MLLRYGSKGGNEIPYYKINNEYTYDNSPEKPFSRKELNIPAEKSSKVFRIQKYQQQTQKRHGGIIPYCSEYMSVEQCLHASRVSAARAPVSRKPVK